MWGLGLLVDIWGVIFCVRCVFLIGFLGFG